MAVQRREFLGLGALAAGGALLRARVAFALPDTGKSRFLLVIMRGALDGLAAVPPLGDRDYPGLRREFALRPPGESGGALPLGGFFGLHPSLAPTASARTSTDGTCSRMARRGRAPCRRAGSTGRSAARGARQSARPAWQSDRAYPS
jgi:uncharacterized protein (DUF1501 family)